MKTIKVKDFMAVSGKGGLFRYLAQARNGIIIESLEDKKRTVASSTAKISALDDISVFTKDEDISLCDVFMRIHDKENGGVAIDPKMESNELSGYFKEVLPEYDEERVYISDIKKVLTWYNLLHKYELLEVIEKEEKSADEADAAEEEKSADEAVAKEKKK